MFNKARIYSLREFCQLVIYIFCRKVIERIPRKLKETDKLVDKLLSNGTRVKKDRGTMVFKYPLNKKEFLFQLKRDSSDPEVFQQIILGDEYGAIVDLFKKNDMRMENVVDAGANIGSTSLYLQAHFSGCRVIALEPSSGTFARLKNHITKNELGNVTCLNKGLWSHSTFLAPDTSFRDGLDWSFRLVEAAEGKKGTFQVTSVADLLREYHLRTIDLLKIDIEGGEAAVFGEKADLAWLSQVKVIAIEIHDEFDCRKDIEDKLSRHGFKLFASGELTVGINTNVIKDPMLPYPN